MLLTSLSFYLQSKHINGIKTSVLYVNNKPNLITLDYTMDVQELFPDSQTRYNLVYNSKVHNYLLLGSYYAYWSRKCVNLYFLDQPVSIFGNIGKFSKQYI